MRKRGEGDAQSPCAEAGGSCSVQCPVGGEGISHLPWISFFQVMGRASILWGVREPAPPLLSHLSDFSA